MRRWSQLALLLLLAGCAAGARAGEVIDRIVATVNSAPILQSDVEAAARYEAFLEGHSVAALSPTEEQATLQRVIDQELLRQQMGKDYPPPTTAELADRIGKLKAQIPGGQTDEGWRNALSRYGLTEDEVTERVAVQMQISRLIEQRLRPAIHIDLASVQAYYRDKLLPELKKSGIQQEPPLRQVRPKIEEVLIQERMDEELTNWLQSLRQQSRIRTAPEIAAPTMPSQGVRAETGKGK